MEQTLLSSRHNKRLGVLTSTTNGCKSTGCGVCYEKSSCYNSSFLFSGVTLAINIVPITLYYCGST